VLRGHADVWSLSSIPSASASTSDSARRFKGDDLCRDQGHELVLVNSHYGLIGLAIGPAEPPRRLAVQYGTVRLEHGSAAEILGEAPHRAGCSSAARYGQSEQVTQRSRSKGDGWSPAGYSRHLRRQRRSGRRHADARCSSRLTSASRSSAI
jgi:hypothetical protein